MRRAPISRGELESRAGESVSKPGAFKPELRPVVAAGVPCLAKDFARRPWPIRETWGRFSVAREASVYEALADTPGVPRYLGRVDGLALVVERIDGLDARKVPNGGFPEGFFDHLEEVVRGLHARGVVHGDLRQRRNVLLGPDGRPYVVDYASGVRLPRGSFLLRLLADRDLSGVAKLRARYAPATLTAADRRRLALDRFRPFRRRRLTRRMKKL